MATDGRLCVLFIRKRLHHSLFHRNARLIIALDVEKGGNVFTFIMEKENVDFVNAAHILASRYGIIIPETTTKELTEEGIKKNNQRGTALFSSQKIGILLYKNTIFISWYCGTDIFKTKRNNRKYY